MYEWKCSGYNLWSTKEMYGQTQVFYVQNKYSQLAFCA